jgi:hypothetical protein
MHSILVAFAAMSTLPGGGNAYRQQQGAGCVGRQAPPPQVYEQRPCESYQQPQVQQGCQSQRIQQAPQMMMVPVTKYVPVTTYVCVPAPVQSQGCYSSGYSGAYGQTNRFEHPYAAARAADLGVFAGHRARVARRIERREERKEGRAHVEHYSSATTYHNEQSLYIPQAAPLATPAAPLKQENQSSAPPLAGGDQYAYLPYGR